MNLRSVGRPPVHRGRDETQLDDRRGHLLIAEDNQSTQWALQRLFEDLEYRVDTVSDGSELLYTLEPVILEETGYRPPDLIITDVRMPGIDAFNIVEQLREVGWQTPVLIMTAFGSNAVEHRTQQLDHAYYFEKPVDIDELEAVIEEIVG